MKFPIQNFKFPLADASAGGRRRFRFPLSAFRFGRAFSLIEIMVVVGLLSLIVVALMAVFSSTQRAFRSGVTQTDVMEGARAAVELITTDLHGLAPSGGTRLGASTTTNSNFQVANNASYSGRLLQPLPGSSSSARRTNLLQQVYILNRQYNKWWGVGYAVVTNSPDGLFSLYRKEYPVGGIFNGTNNPAGIRPAFNAFFANPTNGGSHVISGVINFSFRAYDKNGVWINNTNNFLQPSNCIVTTLQGGEKGLVMFSNVVPAVVELNLAVVEDRALARAQSSPTFFSQSNYLSQQVGAVHLFRQRVIVPNVDRMAYYPTNQ